MAKYDYQLDRSRGTSKKYTCPSCGARKSFRRYVNIETGGELGDDCGKCDHENSCGYHMPPREYFKEHPELNKDWRKEHEVQQNWATVDSELTAKMRALATAGAELEVKTEKDFTLPITLLDKYHSSGSNFVRWLVKDVAQRNGFSMEQVKLVYEDYRLGADSTGRVIFWQIDREGRLRTGKFMQYADDGHRTGNPNWMHSYMVQEGTLNEATWELRQCLFGEHLLTRYPDRPVSLVEAEKTAVIASLFHPEQVWVATGGCGQLSEEKLAALRGRIVTVHPDSGAFLKWYKQLLMVDGLHFDILSKYESLPPNADLADVLLGEV